MKEYGQALRGYHNTFNSFPPGTIPNPSLVPEDRFSWIISIWPMLERDNDYQKLDLSKGWNAPKNRIDNVYGPYRCHEYCDNYWSAIGSYIGIAGIGPNAATYSLTDPKAGVFGYDRITKLKDVTDGESTTIMVMETNYENGLWCAGGFPTVRGLDPSGSKYLGFAGQFGSLHRIQESSPFRPFPPQASNCVFVDGSVRLISETIDPVTFEALCTIAGGEKVELPVDY
jgi:hypothetical protein